MGEGAGLLGGPIGVDLYVCFGVITVVAKAESHPLATIIEWKKVPSDTAVVAVASDSLRTVVLKAEGGALGTITGQIVLFFFVPTE